MRLRDSLEHVDQYEMRRLACKQMRSTRPSRDTVSVPEEPLVVYSAQSTDKWHGGGAGPRHARIAAQ